MPVNLILLTNIAGPVWQRSMGAYQVASHCRQAGFTCQVIDFTDLFKVAELESMITGLIDDRTLAIGVSTTFYFNKTTKGRFVSADRDSVQVMPEQQYRMLRKIKKQYPHVKIICGGANSYHAQGDDLFDAVFHGYSEQSVVEYLQACETKQKRLWPTQNGVSVIDGKTSHFDITTLQHSWHQDDCVLDAETLPIEISRGCIFKCKFCSYPLNGKKKFDYLRDTELIKAELIRNHELFGTTNYFFTDDTFNDSTMKVQQLHDMIVSLPFKIKFVTYLRLDLLHAHPEQIPLLKNMGLGSAFFGIETLNHASGKIIGKGMRSDLVKEFLLELYHVHWHQEIPFTCSYIIGLPEETSESILSTQAWCRTTPFNNLWFPLQIKNHSHYQSEFDLNYEQYGYQLDQQGKWYSQQMTYEQALELAEGFNQTGIYTEQTPSSWLLFSLLSYGFTIPELKDIKIEDLHWPSLLLKKFARFKEYKQLLITALQK